MGAACVCEDPIQSRLSNLEDNMKSINNLLLQMASKSSSPSPTILECSVSHKCESCVIASEKDVQLCPEENQSTEHDCPPCANVENKSPEATAHEVK